MFTIIYEKSNGRVISITSESNAEFLREALPTTNDFIFVDELPQIIPYRQTIKVVDSILVVEDLVLTKEQEEEIKTIELNNIREQRQIECFAIINRGKLWYDTLTEEQVSELNVWYNEWLNLPNKYTGGEIIYPKKPNWLK